MLIIKSLSTLYERNVNLVLKMRTAAYKMEYSVFLSNFHSFFLKLSGRVALTVEMTHATFYIFLETYILCEILNILN